MLATTTEDAKLNPALPKHVAACPKLQAPTLHDHRGDIAHHNPGLVSGALDQGMLQYI